jgi:hypothetical protein
VTSLDATILVVSALLACYALATGRGVAIAFIVFLSFTFNEWAITTLDLTSYEAFYETGANWMVLIAVKDFLIVALLSYRLKKEELLLMVIFITSCGFHQLCRMDFINSNVDNMPMYDIRFTFMQIVAALQLAGVFITFNGSGLGGKRGKSDFPWNNNRVINLFHNSAHKAKP